MIQSWNAKTAVVECGGPSCDPEGCGATIEVALTRRRTHDGLAAIDATEAAEKNGWTSDYPGWQTMMVGISHKCPSCSMPDPVEQIRMDHEQGRITGLERTDLIRSVMKAREEGVDPWEIIASHARSRGA